MSNLIPTPLLNDYHGCGAYLAAFDAAGTLIAIRQVSSIPLHRMPTFLTKRGGLSKAERTTRAKTVADSFRAWQKDRTAWADDIRAWKPEGASEVVALDASCTELVARMSNASWAAHDALNGTDRIGIIDREQMERAFADEARLCG
ncbi:MAG: hypothetical protein M0006_08195 [Magnetospirillum sp.]|nr:hypothetical protein [Magnetospirillum sp.]